MTLELKHPFNMMVSGPSNCGKTVFALKLIQNLHTMCNPIPIKVFWAYIEWQPQYSILNTLPYVQLIEGVPDFELLKQDKHIPKLLVTDDMMCELKANENLIKLFSRGSHHWNCSCIHLVQSIFYEGLKTPRRNATYMVLFRSPSDTLQVHTYGRHIFPSKPKYFQESYEDSTSKAHGYLFLNLHQQANDKYKLYTQIFPDETTYVYTTK